MAVEDPEVKNVYRLYGYKFFSSATDADVSLTLARIVDPATGKTTAVGYCKICNKVKHISCLLLSIREQKDCRSSLL